MAAVGLKTRGFLGVKKFVTMPRKPRKKGSKMTAVSSRLAQDNIDRLCKFLDLTGVPQSKVINECLRIGLPFLEARWRDGNRVFTKPSDTDTDTQQPPISPEM
jgi:hypothetical protein